MWRNWGSKKMKRDMDLCRKILQLIEDTDAGAYTIEAESLGEFSGSDQGAVDHHVKIMVGAGFIESSGSVHGSPIVRGLTWEGHEFVEKSRDPGLWEKAKRLAKEKTGGITIEILTLLLSALAKKAIGIDDE
jgi:hypothetical protein